MGFKNALKLNMEICYVPVAKLKDVKEMMSNWNNNNKLIKYWSFVSIAIAFINLFYLGYSELAINVDFARVICIISQVIMAVLAFLVNKSNKLFLGE